LAMGAEGRIGFEVHELTQQDKPISFVGGPVKKGLNFPDEGMIVDKKQPWLFLDNQGC